MSLFVIRERLARLNLVMGCLGFNYPELVDLRDDSIFNHSAFLAR
jgi:hypothetical protein